MPHHNELLIGPLMLDLEGLALNLEEKKLIQHPLVGGIIFFARNFSDRQQLQSLVDEIRLIRPQLLLCVDQEGGRVQRFREGFTRIPPMQLLGERLLSGEPNAAQLIKDCGWLMASEILSCGIDFSFAPVLDVDFDQCEVIADRSFANDPAFVSEAAGYFVAGMHEAGMAATGKHFPGHGGVRADSHLETPYDNRSLDEIRCRDLAPFVALSGSLDAVMPAHIVFPNIDSDAVGFSRFWLQEILRADIGFEGVIFSDDLSMKGADVAGGYAEKARSALSAGCDMVLVCNHREGAFEVLSFLESERENGLFGPSTQLEAMRRRQQPEWSSLKQDQRWQLTVQKLASIGIC